MPNRRDFLFQLNRRAAGLALLGLFGGACASRAEKFSGAVGDPFQLGIASGMPRPDSVVLWTRLAPQPQAIGGGMVAAPVALRWELADDEAFSRRVRRGELVALPGNAHAVHVRVDGLTADARYFYRFIAGDAVSPVGRTRTAPAPDADVARLRFALMSCQHFEQGFYAAHREVASRDIDLVLFVGDYLYESSNPRLRLRSHEAPPPHTLDEYRRRHATYKSDADLRAAHAAHPWVVTWDDHEVENDYAGDHSPSGLDAAAFLSRRTAAYKAYFEHMPVAPSLAPSGPAMRVHDRYAWGRLADLWTLDNRQYRDVQPCAGERGAGGRTLVGCETLDDPARSLFGTAQERWLHDGLATSRRRWRLVAQGTQISSSGVDTAQGRRVSTDGWDGYPKARERLLQAIAEPRRPNTVCLGGDVHRHVGANLRLRPNDERSPIVSAEFVCSAVSSRGATVETMSRIRGSNPDIVAGRGGDCGYALIDVTPASAECEFRGAAFPVRSESSLTTHARVAVLEGRPEMKLLSA